MISYQVFLCQFSAVETISSSTLFYLLGQPVHVCKSLYVACEVFSKTFTEFLVSDASELV